MFVAASNSTTPSTYIVAAATAAATANVTPTPPVTNGGMETATATGTPALSDIKLICTRRKKVRSSWNDREAVGNWSDLLCSLENQTSYLCDVRRKSSNSFSQWTTLYWINRQVERFLSLVVLVVSAQRLFVFRVFRHGEERFSIFYLRLFRILHDLHLFLRRAAGQEISDHQTLGEYDSQ